MNIVWLTPEMPFPAIGGRNGVYNRIVQLGTNNNIFLFSITYPSDDEKCGFDEMIKYCKEVHFYNRGLQKKKSFFKGMLYPHCVATRDNQLMKRDIVECCKKNKIDIIVMDFPHMYKDFLPALKERNIPVTVQQHNVEFLTMRSLSKIDNMPFFKRMVYYLESKRLEWYEKSIYKKDVIKSFSFFSETDKEFFENTLKVSQKCQVIPLGANKKNKEVAPFYEQKKNIIFVGKMSGEANAAAVIWFAKNVFPLIKKEVPEVQFYIVGANPGKEIYELENGSVHVTGGYDIPDKYYEGSMLTIVPVFNGGGVKGKLLEAISFKRPVVTTNHGICGTKFEKNIHLKVNDDIKGFAEDCIDILNNPFKYDDMVGKAYKLFEENYTWSSIGELYEEFLHKTIEFDRGKN